MSSAPAGTVGIIAGTGFYSLAGISDPRSATVRTEYGPASLTRGSWHGVPVVFLPRHGPGHAVPPHLVDYRANIRALADAGCGDVLAVNVTGGIDPTLVPGDLVCVDDFLDLTRGRVSTFFDGTTPEGVVHTDMLAAYHPELRAEILSAAAQAGQPIRDGGVYACFDGPRFETPAEIRLARLAGADVAGMTGVPEVSLAVEAGLRYAAISLVVNPAAGVGDTSISMADIDAALAVSSDRVLAVLDAFVRRRAAAPGAEGGES